MPLINLDFQQVEVVIAAQLSGDETLIKLLKDGIDIHRYILSKLYNEPYESLLKSDPRRDTIKTSTFGILYGNGPKTLSERVGKSKEWAKDFINDFYTLFPGIKKWHDYLLEEVEDIGQIKTAFGSILKFKKFPAKFHWQDKNKMYYNPPDIKNYPVQHVAQIILALYVGQFFRTFALHKKDKYLMVNTVHDSLMLDCRPEFIEECKKDLLETLDFLPILVYNLFKIRFRVVLKAEISVADSWYNLK